MRKLAAIVCLAMAAAGPAWAEGLSTSAQAAISHYRAEHGLPPVTPDAKLMRLAAEQANAMARAGVLDHDVGRPFQVRVASYGPEVAVENIAAGARTFPAALDMWKHSAGHDANLRRAGVTRFGIASAEAPDSKYKVFWALIMAGEKPKSRVREAGAPGLMAAAPTQGPKVRVRSERTEKTGSTDLMASLKGLLKPLLPGDKSDKK
jgi:cysteine-rich secretory family protein